MADEFVPLSNREELDRLARDQADRFREKAEALARLSENPDFGALLEDVNEHVEQFRLWNESPSYPDAKRQYLLGMLWGLRYVSEHPRNVARKLADRKKIEAARGAEPARKDGDE